MKSTWRLIVLTVVASLLCWGAALLSLRAVAQSPPASGQPAGAGAPSEEAADEADEEDAGEQPLPAEPAFGADGEGGQLRDSADNNVSFPIDI